MRETLLIQLPNLADQPASWVHIDAEGAVISEATAPLATLGDRAKHARVIAFAPAASIVVHTLELPGKSQKQWRQVAPFALEELLADDIEQYHFALGAPLADGRVNCATGYKSNMDNWLAQLADANIVPQILTTPALALPASETADSGRLLIHGHFAWACLADGTRLAAETDLLAAIWPPGTPADITITGAGSVPPAPWSEANIQYVTTPLIWFADHIENFTAINLLQGDYRPQNSWASKLKIWAIAAILLICCITLAMVDRGIELSQLQAQNNKLNNQISQLVTRAMPGAKIVNAKVQLERELARLQTGGTAIPVGFLDALSHSGTVLQKIPDLTIRTLNYRNNILEMQITAQQVSAADLLKQYFSEIPAVKAELKSVNAQEKGVDIRLHVTNTP